MREEGASELVPKVLNFGSDLLRTFEQILVEVPCIIDLRNHIVEHIDRMRVDFIVLGVPEAVDFVVGLL